MQPRAWSAACDGKACAGKARPGRQGNGLTFSEKLQLLKGTCEDPYGRTSQSIFAGYEYGASQSEDFSLPVLAAPIGMVAFSFSDALNEYSYAQAVVTGMIEAGSLAFTGGGAQDESFYEPLKVIGEHNGRAIPTLKPWTDEILYERISLVEEVHPIAFAMDIDTAGLVHAAASKSAISKKGPDDIRAICERTKMPLIVKGIMTAEQRSERSKQAPMESLYPIMAGESWMTAFPLRRSCRKSEKLLVGKQKFLLTEASGAAEMYLRCWL